MPRFSLNRDFAMAAGDIADIYLSSIDWGGRIQPTVVKMARNIEDNTLLATEAGALRRLNQGMKDPWVSTVPTIYESFVLNSEDRLRVNILQHFPGFLSAADIRRLVPSVDGRTLAWMWKRILGLLTWVHSLNLIHGALLPPHLLFFPDNAFRPGRDIRKHSVRVIDWCYSIDYAQIDRLVAWCPDYEDFYPDTVRGYTRGNGPETDLFMAAKTMVYLSGGDVAQGECGPQIPAEISESIRRCFNLRWTLTMTAGGLLEDFTKLLVRVYGPPKFHEFVLPGI